MLIGEYRHTLDDKRRLALPVKFRKVLGKRIVITHGLDNCLFVFSTAQWASIVEKLSKLSMGEANARAFGRYLFAGASELDIDPLGRVLLPAELVLQAGLGERVVVLGINDRVELWSEERWDPYRASVEKEADAVAQKLGEVGIL